MRFDEMLRCEDIAFWAAEFTGREDRNFLLEPFSYHEKENLKQTLEEMLGASLLDQEERIFYCQMLSAITRDLEQFH